MQLRCGVLYVCPTHTHTLQTSTPAALGFTELFPVQAAVWRELAGGTSTAHDACICAPTGSGKTLAYALPLLTAAAEGRWVCVRGRCQAVDAAGCCGIQQPVHTTETGPTSARFPKLTTLPPTPPNNKAARPPAAPPLRPRRPPDPRPRRPGPRHAGRPRAVPRPRRRARRRAGHSISRGGRHRRAPVGAGVGLRHTRRDAGPAHGAPAGDARVQPAAPADAGRG
jgi:hypothetical protein